MATVTITADNFKDTIDKGGIVLLDFWAEWCGPCRAFGPIFEEASNKHADIVFGKINSDEQQELAAAFEIRSIPTLMVFREKVLLLSQAGALPAASLEDVVAEVRKLDMAKVHQDIAEREKSLQKP